MPECDELIDQLRAATRDHVHLAVIAADAVPVAEMHLELAIFSEERARAAEEICEDA